MVSMSEAVVVVKVDGEKNYRWRIFGWNWFDRRPDNALSKALAKDLGPYQGMIDDMRLVDFKVRITQGGTEAVPASSSTARMTKVGVGRRLVSLILLTQVLKPCLMQLTGNWSGTLRHKRFTPSFTEDVRGIRLKVIWDKAGVLGSDLTKIKIWLKGAFTETTNDGWIVSSGLTSQVSWTISRGIVFKTIAKFLCIIVESIY